MEPAVLIAALALGVSVIGFFYKLGQDTKDKGRESDGGKLDQIYDRIEDIGGKVDKIIEWQQTAHGIHESHKEQLKTLFRRVENLESRMEDREVMNTALQKILEGLS